MSNGDSNDGVQSPQPKNEPDSDHIGPTGDPGPSPEKDS